MIPLFRSKQLKFKFPPIFSGNIIFSASNKQLKSKSLFIIFGNFKSLALIKLSNRILPPTISGSINPDAFVNSFNSKFPLIILGSINSFDEVT